VILVPNLNQAGSVDVNATATDNYCIGTRLQPVSPKIFGRKFRRATEAPYERKFCKKFRGCKSFCNGLKTKTLLGKFCFRPEPKLQSCNRCKEAFFAKNIKKYYRLYKFLLSNTPLQNCLSTFLVQVLSVWIVIFNARTDV